MKNYIGIALLLFMQSPAFCQVPKGVSAKTNIYIVRHGEKESGSDPVLTESGKKRAGDLMRTLKNKYVKRSYVTQFKRTQMTTDSLRLQLEIDTVHYHANENGNDLFKKIALHGDFNKTILIVGHSNTVPDYIKKAGVTNYPQADIPDNEFDNIYKVYYRRPFLFMRFRAHVTIAKYGVPSVAGN